ncbi:11640_t:CDS:2, partial [Cetraspora pellucida]
KNGYEIGIGENTGPMHKDHYKKSVSDFVNVIKVARAQHISFQTKCIEESGINPLSSKIQNDLKRILVPFFQDLPTKEDDIINAVFLCKRFLIHRNLLNRTSRLSKTAIKNSQIFRESIENIQLVQYDKKPVKLGSIVSPRTNRE